MKTFFLLFISLINLSAHSAVQENKCEAYYDTEKNVIVLTNDIQGNYLIVEKNCLEVAKEAPVISGIIVNVEIKYFYPPK